MATQPTVPAPHPSRLTAFLLKLLTSPGWRLVRGPLLTIVLRHVARAGFMPQPFEKAGARIAGQVWHGQVIAATDHFPPAVVHYLRHAVVQREWPERTTFADYAASLEQIVRDPQSGVLVSRYRNGWHLAVVRKSGPLRGIGGAEYVMVEYRFRARHWMTGFQLSNGLAHFTSRKDQRWLRRPQ